MALAVKVEGCVAIHRPARRITCFSRQAGLHEIGYSGGEMRLNRVEVTADRVPIIWDEPLLAVQRGWFEIAEINEIPVLPLSQITSQGKACERRRVEVDVIFHNQHGAPAGGALAHQRKMAVEATSNANIWKVGYFVKNKPIEPFYAGCIKIDSQALQAINYAAPPIWPRCETNDIFIFEAVEKRLQSISGRCRVHVYFSSSLWGHATSTTKRCQGTLAYELGQRIETLAMPISV